MSNNQQNYYEGEKKHLKGELTKRRIYRSLAGGLIGAGVGYYVNPKMGNKIIFGAVSAGLKEKGREFYNITKSGVYSLLNDPGDRAHNKEIEAGSVNRHHQSLKNDNENMLNRIQQLERKYQQLSEDRSIEESEENNKYRDLRQENYNLQKRMEKLEKYITI